MKIPPPMLRRTPKKYHKEATKLWYEWAEALLANKTDLDSREYIIKYGSKEFASHTKDKYERIRAAQDKLDRKGTGGRVN